MNLNPHRPWITPVVIGAFFLSAVTGVLMFFHLDSGLNKTAHEWLSWAMVIGVSLHLLLHLPAFKRYFTQTSGRVVIGLFAAVLALSFIPAGGAGGEPGFAPPVRALAKAPIPVLAQVAGTSTEDVTHRIRPRPDTQGFTPPLNLSDFKLIAFRHGLHAHQHRVRGRDRRCGGPQGRGGRHHRSRHARRNHRLQGQPAPARGPAQRRDRGRHGARLHRTPAPQPRRRRAGPACKAAG
jgi:hypothetical protein